MKPVDAERALARSIEATRLGFGLTAEAVRALVESAGALRVGGVCVPPIFVAAARDAVAKVEGWTPDVVSVANFPTGDHPLSIVERVAAGAAEAGANHIDLVVPGALVMEGRFVEVERFVARVYRAAAGAAGSASPVELKVILETAALGEEQVRGAAVAAIAGGAQWLKTSTGFHPAGGATEAAVALLRSIAPAGIGIKASGGIRTREDARRMISAGADRIGTSSEAVILGPVAG